MNLHLAPIQDITTAHFRDVFTTLFGGIDVYYSPFIATTHMRHHKSPLFEDVLPKYNTSTSPLVPQLLSNKSDDFIFFAKVLGEMGYKEVNWNIGCPFLKVTKKKKGSGILPYPDQIKDFLDKVCKEDAYQVSIKMRLGMVDYQEGLKVMEVLNDYPLKHVILHSRTGNMMYNGSANLDAFDHLQSACRHPLIYNGDIFTIEDFNRIQNRFPNIEDFMIGRGALRDPFLAAKIKGAEFTPLDQYNKLKEYHDRIYKELEASYELEQYLISRMKAFWFFSSDQVDPSGEFLKRIQRCRTKLEYLRVCDDFFERLLNPN